MTTLAADCLFPPHPPVAILGVPFDVVTSTEAIALIENMIASRRPHYFVTPNVDFLVQASEDVELRRILFEAHLVVCDGTPLVWASRLLGNPLPERIAGSDLVPMLLKLSARRGYRVFLLGATETSALKAVSRLRQDYPDLIIAGHYSPPFNELLEMDHERIRERIAAARPDLLLVSFGCPKQEKWIAMHYRTLAVPVTAGVGGTIDFLAGEFKRAPVWMQKAGAEWIFRLGQEPRRLFRRYTRDLWVFSRSFLSQWWQLRPPGKLQAHQRRRKPAEVLPASPSSTPVTLAERSTAPHNVRWQRIQLPERLDLAAVREGSWPAGEWPKLDHYCLVEAQSVKFVDSTGIGWLIQWHKKLQSAGYCLILTAPSTALQRALSLLRLHEFFIVAEDAEAARATLSARLKAQVVTKSGMNTGPQDLANSVALAWHGEITTANAAQIWDLSLARFQENSSAPNWQIDLSGVRFIDSSGLGLLVRMKKLARTHDKTLAFVGLQPAVRNVIQLARLTDFLAETVCNPA